MSQKRLAISMSLPQDWRLARRGLASIIVLLAASVLARTRLVAIQDIPIREITMLKARA